MKEVLKVNNISKTYQALNGEVEALKSITFDVKEGFTMPENPVFISLHGKVFCTPKRIIRINDRKFVMVFNASDQDFYMLDGGALELDQHTTYRDFFSAK